jgi:hypothetical protein
MYIGRLVREGRASGDAIKRHVQAIEWAQASRACGWISSIHYASQNQSLTGVRSKFSKAQAEENEGHPMFPLVNASMSEISKRIKQAASI